MNLEKAKTALVRSAQKKIGDLSGLDSSFEEIENTDAEMFGGGRNYVRIVVRKGDRIVVVLEREFQPEIDTADFERVHGKKPTGLGSWAFFVGRDTEPTIVRHTGSYAQAKKWILSLARAKGRKVRVAP